MTPLLRICAWCQREIGHDGAAVGEPLHAAGEFFRHRGTRVEITHGMCKSCEAEELRKLLPAKVTE